MESVDNFRDVAGIGAGYSNNLGLRVNRGVFYRSNALASNDADATTLDQLGLSAVYDLRTDGEIASKPDRVPAGARYTRHPLTSGQMPSSSSLESAEQSREFMRNMNRQFVTDPEVRAELGALLTDLAESDGPQLFHCTAGKDRAGWTAAILLSIAGVNRETIYADYLLSNTYSAKSIEATRILVTEHRGPEGAAIIEPLLVVDPSYLDAGFDQLEADYDTINNYLLTGLGLSPQTIAILVAKLVG
ncbi:tyrosine-protein phosphatase [Rhodococcus sp. 24CO]|uniref:tyrosine-protein phosphatase n=1 Tax=Rhodococcus sp. 24CO TaxID=3117460 RepID=UPI003D33C3E3